jgi:hypothetical protein
MTMSNAQDRATFLALCAAEDYEAAIGILATQPPWLTEGDAAVRLACLRAAPWFYAAFERQEARVQTLLDVARTQQAQVTALLEQLAARQAQFAAAQAAVTAAKDDLDVFQAGYERGYAQGWQQRGTLSR